MKENRPLAEQMAQLNAPDTTTENSYMDGSSLRNETCPAALLRSIDESLEKLSQKKREKPAVPAPCRKEMSATYKISLCDVFNREGKCPYGTSCRFAHGKNELRMRDQRPARTVKFGGIFYAAPAKPARGRCRNFMAGNCRFGERCHYLHLVDSSEMPKLMNTTIQPYINQSFSEVPRQLETPPQAMMYPQQQLQPDFNQTLPAQGTTYYYQQVQQAPQQFAQFQQYPYYMMNNPSSFLPPFPPPQSSQQLPYYQMYPPFPQPMIQQNVQYYQ